jgi:hypothetical protein
MRRGSGWAQLLGAVCASGGLAASACGSRSSLDELIVVLPRDGGASAGDAPEPPLDGTTDGPADAPSPLDAPVDAPPDVPPPRDAGPDIGVPPNCSSPSILYVYMFTESNHIWSLYPQTGTLSLIGTINCSSSGTPFSMAVDRNGSAYVLYQLNATSSEMFHVSLRTLDCTRTPWVSPGPPYGTFGMGFVGDSNGLTDTLYVAADGNGTPSANATLGKLDLTTFKVTTVGDLAVRMPELSGTLDGRLFAFYGTTSGSSAVDQVDPSSLAHVKTYSFSNLPQGSGWAFGFWGGDFYLFTAPPSPPPGAVSVITRYRPSDRSQTTLATLDEAIVGAGVSTCAPQM